MKDYEVLAKELMVYQGETNLLAHGKRGSILEGSKGEHMLLGFLYHAKDKVLPSEIAKKCGISAARTAAIIKSLEKKGYITREADLEDRRRVNINMTEKGKIATEAKEVEILEDIENMLKYLGHEDAEEYVRIMKRVLGYFENLNQNSY